MIIVSYRDVYGDKHVKTAKGLEARVIQHEIDHLNGLNIVHRVQKEGDIIKIKD